MYADEGQWNPVNAAARRAPDPGMVAAARDGDAQALEALLADVIPLVYNIVGRALDGHADVDDVVQETLLRMVRGLSGLREPEAFRSWLVAIAVRQVRDREQERRKAYVHSSALDTVLDVADPASDFVSAGIRSLSMADRRRVVVLATRWLDPDNRALLALWWLEEIGELERADLAAALGLTVRHAAVRILRMKEQMQSSCMVVKALQAYPGCTRLRDLTADWDGEPSPLWRKRVSRHVRDCDTCWQLVGDLLPVDGLVRSLPLLPVPAHLAGRWTASLHHAAGGAHSPSPSANANPSANPNPAAPRHVPTAQKAHGAAQKAHGVVNKSVVNKSVVTKRPRGLLTFAGHGGLLPVSVATVVVGAVVGTLVAVLPGGTPAPARPTDAARGVAISPAATPPGPASPSVSPSTAPATPSATHSTPASTVVAAPPAKTALGKKGVSAWTFNGVGSALAQSGADWYYTWSTAHSGITAPVGVGFVPMIWGPGSVTSANLAQAKAAGPYLLGFNEPDMAAQSNMTVDQALSLWPQLMASGKILGSPAVATGAATAGGWLDQFMSGAQARGYRVDFITLHWYGSDFTTADAVSQLKSYIQAVYARYHKPIWLTEYALIDFSHGETFPSDQQQAAFVTASAQMLTSLSYVQRYAWFALPASDSAASSGLFRSGPAVTAVGRAFEAAAGG